MGKRVQKKARAAARRRRRWRNIIIGVVVVAGAITAFAATQPPAPDPSLPALVAEEVSKGPAEATVTITEYGDFNCPSCRQYHQLGIIDQVLAQFPGEVRFVWRHFPVITPSSLTLPKRQSARPIKARSGNFTTCSSMRRRQGKDRWSDLRNSSDWILKRSADVLKVADIETRWKIRCVRPSGLVSAALRHL